MPKARINLLDLNFDLLTFEDLTQRLVLVNPGTANVYLVTPNLQHVVQVRLRSRPGRLFPNVWNVWNAVTRAHGW